MGGITHYQPGRGTYQGCPNGSPPPFHAAHFRRYLCTSTRVCYDTRRNPVFSSSLLGAIDAASSLQRSLIRQRLVRFRLESLGRVPHEGFSEHPSHTPPLMAEPPGLASSFLPSPECFLDSSSNFDGRFCRVMAWIPCRDRPSGGEEEGTGATETQPGVPLYSIQRFWEFGGQLQSEAFCLNNGSDTGP